MATRKIELEIYDKAGNMTSYEGTFDFKPCGANKDQGTRKCFLTYSDGSKSGYYMGYIWAEHSNAAMFTPVIVNNAPYQSSQSKNVRTFVIRRYRCWCGPASLYGYGHHRLQVDLG